jgi:hypothetical protein
LEAQVWIDAAPNLDATAAASTQVVTTQKAAADPFSWFFNGLKPFGNPLAKAYLYPLTRLRQRMVKGYGNTRTVSVSGTESDSG